MMWREEEEREKEKNGKKNMRAFLFLSSSPLTLSSSFQKKKKKTQSHHPADHLLGHVHQVVVVRVRLVELAGRELRVVRQVDALVAELAADLVHAVDAADDEHLEVEFRGHAHKQLLAQVVVPRLKRLCRGAPRQLVHHRGLHLQKLPRVEVAADVLDDLGPDHEDVARARVCQQVEVALPEPRLRVGEGADGHGAQGRGEEGDAAGEEGELAALGLAWSGIGMEGGRVVGEERRRRKKSEFLFFSNSFFSLSLSFFFLFFFLSATTTKRKNPNSPGKPSTPTMSPRLNAEIAAGNPSTPHPKLRASAMTCTLTPSAFRSKNTSFPWARLA